VLSINTENDRNKIISSLIEARISAGITQQELAERIGTKKSAISRIESGQQNLSIDMLLRISNALCYQFKCLKVRGQANKRLLRKISKFKKQLFNILLLYKT